MESTGIKIKTEVYQSYRLPLNADPQLKLLKLLKTMTDPELQLQLEVLL